MVKPLEKQKGEKMSRRTNISDIRRDELTAAALRCIAIKGYDRVTLDDVARESGFSQGIVLYYFKNREALLASTAQKIREDMLNFSRDIWGFPEGLTNKNKIKEGIKKRFSDPDIDLIPFIKEGIKIFIQWFDANSDLIAVGLEFFCQVRRNPVIAEVRYNVQPNYHVALAAFIDQGIKRGIFKKHDPDYAANILLSLITGIAFAYATSNEEGFDSGKMEAELNNLIFGYLQEE